MVAVVVEGKYEREYHQGLWEYIHESIIREELPLESM